MRYVIGCLPLCLLASGVLASNEVLAWKEYFQAQELSQKEKRPLAVFVGNGPQGYAQVIEKGSWSAAVNKLLVAGYVCAYVDAATPEGQALATQLAVTRGRGLVLSDRSGSYQAFHHDGHLTEQELVTRLKQHGPKVPGNSIVAASFDSGYRPLNVTAANFDAIVMQAEVPVLVDFWAPWCGPCRAMSPVMDSVAQEFGGKVRVVKINVDEAPQLAGRYGVSAIPQFLVFQKGEAKARMVGGQSRETLLNSFKAYLR